MAYNVQISSATLINTNSLQIIFSDEWYQEDISFITTVVLSLLNDSQAIETTSGADREYCRFQWQQNYFIIHFECYSQSCWIENETTPNIILLNTIKEHLLNT